MLVKYEEMSAKLKAVELDHSTMMANTILRAWFSLGLACFNVEMQQGFRGLELERRTLKKIKSGEEKVDDVRRRCPKC
ncbi:hypothetical protein NDU88_006503 [Pleurodeles waltl]|uniref:Uncharacterized protein n=1 Tax=Pleurodeles waltl TaxID=8319 RepID=A0AAV7MMH8_PLEWA|nr:hypothetical protein NDU88_006503 [Pleurodeles waltl]